MDILSKLKIRPKEEKDKLKEKKIYFLPTGALVPNPNQTRKSFGNISLVNLADSIQRYGILQPIIIRRRDNVPYVEIGGEKIFAEKYEIVSGERRWRAAQLLNLDEVPCVLIDGDAKTSVEIFLTENIQRKPLHFLEEATGASMLIRGFGSEATETAEILNLTKTSLANRFRVMQLPEAEKSVILKSELSERHAVAISSVENDEKRFTLLEKAISTSMSAPETENAAKELTSPTYRTKGDMKRKVALISDVGFFLNSMNRAITILENTGIKVDKTELESNGVLEICIKIKRKAKTNSLK